MLVITDLIGNVIVVWPGDNQSLASIYPNNPEVLNEYMEYKFSDDKDILDNPQKYIVENGAYRAKTPIELNPPKSNIELLTEIRIKRNQLLKDSDFTQLLDVPLIDVKKEEWKVYRQQLRDFTKICDPNNPSWPIQPI